MMINNLIEDFERFKKSRRLKSYKLKKWGKYELFIGKRSKLDINGNSVYYIMIFLEGLNITRLLKGQSVFQRTFDNYGMTNALNSYNDDNFIKFIIETIEQVGR